MKINQSREGTALGAPRKAAQPSHTYTSEQDARAWEQEEEDTTHLGYLHHERVSIRVLNAFLKLDQQMVGFKKKIRVENQLN